MVFRPVLPACVPWLLALLLCSVPAAAEVADPVIIIVDFQTIIRDSEAAQSIQAKVDDLREAYQDEFGAIEEELRAIEAELTRQRDSAPVEEFIQRRREFEQRVLATQRQAQARRSALDAVVADAMEEVRQTLLAIVADIAQEQDANIVLSKPQVVLVDRSLDFSDEALRRLNAQLPRVEILIPEQARQQE